MKRKRIPKKGNDNVSSTEFTTEKYVPNPADQTVEQTHEKTLNTWEMKEDSTASNGDVNTEKTLNTWEMNQNREKEVDETEDSQIAESEETYTESDSENTGYEFM